MRQFDVFENPSARSRATTPFVVVLQSHHLDPLVTSVVAPVRPGPAPLTLVTVEVEIDREVFHVSLPELAAIDRRLLKASVTNLARWESELRRALERLFSGF